MEPRFLDGHSVSLSLIFMVKLEARVVNVKSMDMGGVLNPGDRMKGVISSSLISSVEAASNSSCTNTSTSCSL